ncbi:ATP-binding protein [Bifidobacterium sp. ESL0745]|uniref:ATP-binding protein n=1 Tax=Bifidobacterium sp. ESL0745 TaxID=2983226 RepID=UPI0023F82451|nr:ATP-binding protein [Bifidobacterium sp. ESL0745]MDF7665615.1 ATP-binding protein [Bifidobacterium sp. ESL0745]
MFVGREHELETMQRLYESNKFEMIVVYGRRRVGKTALIDQFTSDKRTLYFTATQQSTQLNLTEFTRTACRFFDEPESTPTFASWRAAFDFILRRTQREKAEGAKPYVFVFDEFPYAAQAEPGLPSTLQIAIDHGFKSTGVTMILSGSNEGFMESRVLGGKSPLYGRRTAQIKLKPFDYYDAGKFLPDTPNEERVEYYAAFGGTPYYLAAIDPSASFSDNVKRLMFDQLGLIYDEPMMLLREEMREPALYNSVLQAIANGNSTPKRIAEHAGMEVSSASQYLRTLVDLGLVERKIPFGDNPQKSRKGMYVIADPFFAYWFRFVGPNVDAIERGIGAQAAENNALGEAFFTYVGQQFENICLQWAVRRDGTDDLPFFATQFGKWWGNDPVAKEQTDIDMVAANPTSGQILLGECKWRNSFDESDAIAKLQARTGLVPGFPAEKTQYILFGKREVDKATRKRFEGNGTMRFVSTDDLYRP